MFRLALFALLLGLSLTPARAQFDANIACYSYPRTTESYKKKLWDGYEISLGPVPHSLEYGCTAAIYNSAGKVVFRTNGFGVVFDEHLTGEDIDGDGKPEVVFMTDQAGGAHCCWVYNVVSLFPKPHRLFDVGENLGVHFQKDTEGKTIIWEGVGGTTEYTTGMDRPTAERVYRVQAGKLVDATPEFCADIFGSAGSREHDIWTRVLTPENIKKLQSAKKLGVKGEIEVEPVVSALLSRALQRVLCHQYDEAMADLKLWPEAGWDQMMHNFAESIKDVSPEFVKRLAGTTEAK